MEGLNKRSNPASSINLSMVELWVHLTDSFVRCVLSVYLVKSTITRVFIFTFWGEENVSKHFGSKGIESLGLNTFIVPGCKIW